MSGKSQPSLPDGTEPLRVVPVEGRRARDAFIRMPRGVYAEDPAWVPPLVLERREHLSNRNPFFKHATVRCWLAQRGARPVGRISAQIDQLHLERYQDATGFFGMLEAEDDPDVFAALFAVAEDWLRDQGMRRVRGPFSLSINDECGLLVEGFESPPQIMMGHARPYYAPRVEAQGYEGVKDLLAYIVDSDFPAPKMLSTVMTRTSGRVQVRAMRKDRFSEDLEIIRDIFADAWSENWGFVPFTPEEIHHLGKSLKLFVDLNLAQIAEVDGIPAAMAVAFPNLNEAIRDLDGRLLPLGWVKLLWRLKVRHPRSARVPLMGVRRQFHGTTIGAALALLLMDEVRRHGRPKGIREVEMSWILEENKRVRRIIEVIGGRVYKRYRIYEKGLTQQGGAW